MPEDPSDERQPYTAAGAHTCKGMSQVVNANVFDAGKLADAVPFLVQTIEVPFASVRGKDPDLSAVYPAPLLLKNLDRNPSQRYDLGSGLARLLAQHAEVEIDL